MNKIVAASWVFCAVSVSALAADSKTSIRASAGFASPASGDFKDAFKGGANFSLAVGRDLGSHLAVLGELEYGSFSIDEGKVQDAVDVITGDEGFSFGDLGGRISIGGGDTSFLSGSVALKASVLGNDSTFTPYVIAAGGASRRHTSDATIRISVLGFTDSETVDSDSETVPAVSFGGGVHFQVADTIGLFGEGRYHIAFTDDESTKFTSARVGLSLRL